jgi:type II secretory pathway pseudopilin PulG
MFGVNADTVLSSVSVAVAVLAAAFAGLQVSRMRQTWQAQNALEVARDLQSDAQRSGRRALYALKARNAPYEQWTFPQRHDVDNVIQQLNTAAYLDERQLLPPKMLEENWNGVFRNAYVAALPRVQARRDKGAKNLWRPFEDFAKRMIDLYGDPDPYFEEGENP